MTDRYDAFIVILVKDIRDDDAQDTINAIKQIKGVLDVQPHIASASTMIAEARVKEALSRKVIELFH